MFKRGSLKYLGQFNSNKKDGESPLENIEEEDKDDEDSSQPLNSERGKNSKKAIFQNLKNEIRTSLDNLIDEIDSIFEEIPEQALEHI